LASDDDLERGRELFVRTWLSHTPSATQGDGLGPYFNQRSCAACHKLGGIGGAGPNENNVQVINANLISFAGAADAKAARAKWFPHAIDGIAVLHRDSTVEGYRDVRLQRLFLADASHREITKLSLAEKFSVRHAVEQGTGASAAGGRSATFAGDRISRSPDVLEERNTPALFGVGLIDGISLTTLQQLAAAQRPDVRGRPALLPGGSVGRFGWKAQNATLLDFCENACAIELGLETPRRKQIPRPFVSRSPNKPPTEYTGPNVVDITAADVARLTAFAASLPAPRAATPEGKKDEDVRIGERLFASVGCIECHIANLGDIKGIYSDLMLHRIGTRGSGFYGSPTPVQAGPQIVGAAADEFRTPPLWGVADSAPYLHDGSAASLEEAISAHGGQASRAIQQLFKLGADDQLRLLAFLGSLQAPYPTANYQRISRLR
jgi:CxxC motif-containing protein (DUF1111 family)